MSSMPFYIVDAFTKTRYAGNPAGVVLPDHPLTEQQMLAVAAELHLETVFATPCADLDADYVVAYYTAVNRVPLCGHDTIALAAALAQSDRLLAPGRVRLVTDAGTLAVSVSADGEVVMEQALPKYGQTMDPAEAASVLGLPVTEVRETGLPVQVVSTGTPFLIVPVARRAALSALAPDMTQLIAYGDSLEESVAGFYVWIRAGEGTDMLLHARCFCPVLGLPEDPVTGTASGAVGAYLSQHGQLVPDANDVLCFRTEQGQDMGRPGTVRVRLETAGKSVTRVQVSGSAVVVAEGTIEI